MGKEDLIGMIIGLLLVIFLFLILLVGEISISEEKDILENKIYYFVTVCLTDEGVSKGIHIWKDRDLFFQYLGAYSKLNNCLITENSET